MKNYSPKKLHFRMSVVDIYSALCLIVIGLVYISCATAIAFSFPNQTKFPAFIFVLAGIPFYYVVARYRWLTPSFERLKIGSYLRIDGFRALGSSNKWYAIVSQCDRGSDRKFHLISVPTGLLDQLEVQKMSIEELAVFRTKIRLVDYKEDHTIGDQNCGIIPVVFSGCFPEKDVQPLFNGFTDEHP